jgi:hypothetical protein
MANLVDIIAFAKTCQLHQGILSSPRVYSMSLVGKDKRPKYRIWQISIALTDGNITAALIKSKSLDSNLKAKYWTVSGDIEGKQTKSGETVITAGKNIGKANETTSLTQAIYDARSIFNEKLRKGGSIDKSALRLPGTTSIEDLINDKKRGTQPWRVFGMALHDVNKADNWKNVKYPGYIQPKYDGTRYIIVAHPSLPNKIDGFSRGRESYEGQEFILQELLPVLQDYPGLYVDGELWREGYGLQQVSGSSRRQTGADKLNYYVFDCFYLDQALGFEERRNIIIDLEAACTKLEHIKFAPVTVYNNKDEALYYYGEFLNQGYEGGVLRNSDSPYEWDPNREKRSHTTLKIKPMDDDDWPVIGFTAGSSGKDVGALMWILETNQSIIEGLNKKRNLKAHVLPAHDDNKFTSVTKGMTYDQRYAAYDYLTKNPDYFENRLKNKLMRVQFSIISDYGKPQQPKTLGFRDLDLNAEFLGKF